MNRRRGFRLSPIVDPDRTPTTRAALLADERCGETGWGDERPQRGPSDPEELAALVATVAELQRRVAS